MFTLAPVDRLMSINSFNKTEERMDACTDLSFLYTKVYKYTCNMRMTWMETQLLSPSLYLSLSLFLSVWLHPLSLSSMVVACLPVCTCLGLRASQNLIWSSGTHGKTHEAPLLAHTEAQTHENRRPALTLSCALLPAKQSPTVPDLPDNSHVSFRTRWQGSILKWIPAKIFPLFFCFCICVAQWGKKKEERFLSCNKIVATFGQIPQTLSPNGNCKYPTI